MPLADLPDKSGVPVVVSGSAHWHRESLSCQGALALTDDRLGIRLQPAACATMQPMDISQIEGKILVLLQQLQDEGRL